LGPLRRIVGIFWIVGEERRSFYPRRRHAIRDGSRCEEAPLQPTVTSPAARSPIRSGRAAPFFRSSTPEGPLTRAALGTGNREVKASTPSQRRAWSARAAVTRTGRQASELESATRITGKLPMPQSRHTQLTMICSRIAKSSHWQPGRRLTRTEFKLPASDSMCGSRRGGARRGCVGTRRRLPARRVSGSNRTTPQPSAPPAPGRPCQ
jgi:hypothetical protein